MVFRVARYLLADWSKGSELQCEADTSSPRLSEALICMQLSPDAGFTDWFDLQIFIVGEIECDLILYLVHLQNPIPGNLFFLSETKILLWWITCKKYESSSRRGRKKTVEEIYGGHKRIACMFDNTDSFYTPLFY